jgi:signal transduction histidine kinase
MTTRLRFSLLLALLFCGFLVSALALRRQIGEERRASLGLELENRTTLLGFWIEKTERELSRIAVDWAESDDFAGAIDKAQSSSGSTQVLRLMSGSNVSQLWTVQEGGIAELSLNSGSIQRQMALPIDASDLSRLLMDTPNPRFFALAGDDLYEITARRLRRSGSRSWLVIARIWSQNHLSTLARIVDGRAELRPGATIAAESATQGQIVLLRPLQNWKGETIRLLRVECDTSEIESSFRPAWYEMALYAGFGVSVLVAMALAIQAWVLKPLSIIRKSLAAEDESFLGDLAGKQDEFGNLAKLVVSSFRQRADLREEINARRRLQESLGMSESALRQSLEDRARLGRDLHDGVIQSLYAAGMGLAGVKASLKPDQNEAAIQLEQTRATLNETIRDVRNFIVGLEPEISKDGLFSQAIESLVGSMRAMGRFDANISIDNTLAAKLTLTQRAHTLQIAKEAISNALRHGKAERISIGLGSRNPGVVFEITDNGCGFDATTMETHGKGLANFALRARELGAELNVSSDPERGTKIEIIFSLP